MMLSVLLLVLPPPSDLAWAAVKPQFGSASACVCASTEYSLHLVLVLTWR